MRPAPPPPPPPLPSPPLLPLLPHYGGIENDTRATTLWRSTCNSIRARGWVQVWVLSRRHIFHDTKEARTPCTKGPPAVPMHARPNATRPRHRYESQTCVVPPLWCCVHQVALLCVEVCKMLGVCFRNQWYRGHKLYYCCTFRQILHLLR